MLIYLIVLLEGFITISLEILTLRQLMPVVGNSIVITSLIIGVFLLFLAYGYRRGGQHETNHINILKKNFILATIGFGIGLSTIFIETFFYLFHFLLPQSTLIPLISYLLLIVSPIVYVLGQTVPITLNLWRSQQSISKTGGEVLHVSTIGSFFGATVTAIILLNYFGIAWTIFADVLVLIFLILLLTDGQKRIAQGAFLVLLASVVGWINVGFENTMYVATNNYASYQVINRGKQKILMVNDSYSSSLNEKGQSFPYAEYIKHVLRDDLNLKDKSILVLGAGGFTISVNDHYNHYDYVDIDHHIKAVVQKHFLKDINGNFFPDDARHFLRVNTKKYDVIISDVYSNAITIASQVLTLEYYLSIKNTLNENGLAIFNIIANPTFKDPYSKRVDKTLRTAFGNCTVTPLSFGPHPTNLIYICSNAGNEKDPKIYSDNLNSSSEDFFSLKRLIR